MSSMMSTAPETFKPQPCPPESLTVHYSEDQLKVRIKELGEQITKMYKGSPRLVVVIVLRGAFLFAADLVRYIDLPCQVEFIRLASYGDEQKSSGTVRPVDLSLPSLAGEDVLVVEDIIDTGLTLRFLLDYLGSALHTPKSLRLAVLLDKKEARKADVKVDFTGFEIGNEFVVGYGLDFAGYYRNLPFIGVVPPSEQP
jgi:hypoxanthine phosphoribosyltransferase